MSVLGGEGRWGRGRGGGGGLGGGGTWRLGLGGGRRERERVVLESVLCLLSVFKRQEEER